MVQMTFPLFGKQVLDTVTSRFQLEASQNGDNLFAVRVFYSFSVSITLVVHLQRQNIDTEALNLEIPLQAANYLDIKGLLDVTCKTVANMIKGKTPEEIRKTFNIKNDFTEEEEAQVLVLGLIIIQLGFCAELLCGAS